VSETTDRETTDNETDVKLTKLDRSDNQYVATRREAVRRKRRDLGRLSPLFLQEVLQEV